MADNKITGRAKKFDGTRIDYVSIFNWVDGKCLAQVIPNNEGIWEYEYLTDLEVGITYIANGCEPVTHGSYQFKHTVNIPTDFILAYNFNGDYLDKSPNALNGIKTGDAGFVSGRKVGSQALGFVAGCVQTPQAIPLNSNKVTISFWFKPKIDKSGILLEMNDTFGKNNFSLYFLAGSSGYLALNSYTPNGANHQTRIPPILSGFHHIVAVINRDVNDDSYHEIYINNVKVSSTTTSNNKTADAFLNAILYIGQRNASSLQIEGAMQDFRVYNRILTNSERNALFNE